MRFKWPWAANARSGMGGTSHRAKARHGPIVGHGGAFENEKDRGLLPGPIAVIWSEFSLS